MVRKEWVTFLFFIIIAMYAGWVSITELKFGTIVKPGPGFFPFLSSLAIGFFAVVTLFKRLFAAEPLKKAVKVQISWKPVIITFASLVGFTLLMKTIGYNTATFLLLLFLLRTIEKKSWILSTLTALGVTLGAHIIFELILKSEFPLGPFGF